MPQRKIKPITNPEDYEEVRQYIEESARRGRHRHLLPLLNDKSRPPIQLPKLRSAQFEIVSFVQKVAAICQLRGTIAENECNNCHEGRGPFQECIYLKGYDYLTLKCCANCPFDRNTTYAKGASRCSFSKDRKTSRRLATNHVPSLAINNPYTPSPLANLQPRLSLSTPTTHQTSNDIRVLGDLYLPTSSLSLEHRKLVLNLLPDLEALETRNMSTLQKPITNISQAWETFKAIEDQTWIASGVMPPSKPKHTPSCVSALVKPSGLLTSPISHRLHQPSYSTSNAQSEETADPTSTCIAMVMGTVFEQGKTLIYDQIHRRDNKSEGMRNYPQEVLACHDDFTRQIMESSEAKVEVVYGVPVEDYMRRQYQKTSTILPLWGSYDGISVTLIHEEAFRNQQQEFKFRKIILFAKHPNRMFYEPRGSELAATQDKILSVAGRMSGLPHIPRYYADLLWRASQPSKESRLFASLPYSRDLEEFRQASTVQTPANDAQARRAAQQVLDWEHSFLDRPHSNNKLREILPTAIQEVVKALNASSRDWNSPSDMPPTVLVWWRGQKQLLFDSVTVRGLKDIAPVAHACERYLSSSKSKATLEDLSFQYMVLQCMKRQEQHLLIRSGKPARYEDYSHARFLGEVIKVKCRKCDSPGKTDRDPHFSINRPGFLLVRKTYCATCSQRAIAGKQENHSVMMPVDERPWVVDSESRISVLHPLRTPHSYTASVCRQAAGQDQSQKFKQPVESLCIRCKDQTLLSDGRRVYIDHNPKWTLGNVRPLYLERNPACVNCIKNEQASGRFVPRDSDIPSVSADVLRDFAKKFGHLDDVIKSVLLDNLPPSSRELRASKKEYQSKDDPNRGSETEGNHNRDEKTDIEKAEDLKTFPHSSDGNISNQRIEDIEESLPKRRKLSCPYPGCGRTYFSVQTLRRHQEKHAEVTYPCSKCDKIFTSRSGLTTHLPKHEGKTFECPGCGKTYAQKGYVAEHLKAGLCQGKPPTS